MRGYGALALFGNGTGYQDEPWPGRLIKHKQQRGAETPEGLGEGMLLLWLAQQARPAVRQAKVGFGNLADDFLGDMVTQLGHRSKPVVEELK